MTTNSTTNKRVFYRPITDKGPFKLNNYFHYANFDFIKNPNKQINDKFEIFQSLGLTAMPPPCQM